MRTVAFFPDKEYDKQEKQILLGLGGSVFTWEAFVAGALLNSIPGIILQLILIPAVMVALNRTGFVKFYRENRKTQTSDAG